MAYSTTYPPGQVSLLGQKYLEMNILPHITYVGPNGTKFYLAGPLAPTPGAQSGISLQSVKGLIAPFEHLDVQGARQDGTTWLDAVRNPGEIDVVLEASGLTVADSREVLRSWYGANSPKEQGRLTCFTPENGEWWARVRQLNVNTDMFTLDGTSTGRQRLTWAWRNDEAFWESFDSVDHFQLALTSVTDSFDETPLTGVGGLPDAGFPANWDVTFVGDVTGSFGGPGLSGTGNARWYPVGSQARTAVVRRITDTPTSSTDSQVISIRFDAPPALDLFFGNVYLDIWGRMGVSGGHWDGNGIRARIGNDGLIDVVVLSSFIGGVETVMDWRPLLIGPLWNEKWTLICGTSNGVRNYKIQRGGGFTVVNHTETGTASHIGSAYRGWGWGMAAGRQFFSTFWNQVSPPSIRKWEAGDNVPVTQSGFMNLVNRGTEDGWPRYLCYGPGTFTFSDGDSPSNNTVSFGPLLEDQVALITTLPRLRSVVDLSPTQQPQQLDIFQQLIENLVSFAVNNNVPPLLQQFESQFGILPPQGVLYSLLNGRFTTPIDGKFDGQPPVQAQIATSITGGNADSKVVAAITPRRQWPL